METFPLTIENIGANEFGLHELFLVDDAYHTTAASCGNSGSGFFNPMGAICDLNVTVHSLPCWHLSKHSRRICGDDLESWGRRHRHFYTKDASILKNFFSLILQLVSVILSYQKLQLKENKKELIATLKAVIPANETVCEDVEETWKTLWRIDALKVQIIKKVKTFPVFHFRFRRIRYFT